MTDPLSTRFCQRFGVQRPLVQTGMGWVSGASLTVATTRAGGLGIVAATTMSPAEMTATLRSVREQVGDRPFGVNFRPDQPDLRERLAAAAAESVSVVSFAGGPSRDMVTQVHDAGLACMVTVGRSRHAEKMAGYGVDVVIAQGAEGGGHTGDVPTSLLLPAVVDVAPPEMLVLAAGGFRDGRGLVAALAWGADGMAMGTRMLLTQESRVPDAVKQSYLRAGHQDVVLTTALDGHRMSVLRNASIAAIERGGVLRGVLRAPGNVAAVRRSTGQSWPELAREGWAMRRRQGLSFDQLARSANAPIMIRRALVDGDPDGGVLPTGQVVGSIDDLPDVATLFDRIMTEARDVLDRLGG